MTKEELKMMTRDKLVIECDRCKDLATEASKVLKGRDYSDIADYRSKFDKWLDCEENWLAVRMAIKEHDEETKSE
jgi:hypothetical protein